MNAKSILAIIAAWEEDNLTHQPEYRRIHRPAVRRLIAELRENLMEPFMAGDEDAHGNILMSAVDDSDAHALGAPDAKTLVKNAYMSVSYEYTPPLKLSNEVVTAALQGDPVPFDSLDFIMAVEEGKITDEAELIEGLTALRKSGILSSLQGFWQRLARDKGVIL